MCVLFTTPILFEEPSLIASNQHIWRLQLNNCSKEKDIAESNFFISLNYLFNVIKISSVITGSVNIYIYMGV